MAIQTQTLHPDRIVVYLRAADKDRDSEKRRRLITEWLAGLTITVPEDRWYVCHRGRHAIHRYKGLGNQYRSKRPTVSALLDRLRAGTVDTVVCWDLDRLDYNLTDSWRVLGHWLEAGARIVAVDMDLDIQGPTQTATRQIYQAMVRGHETVRRRLGSDANIKRRRQRQLRVKSLHYRKQDVITIAATTGEEIHTVQAMIRARPGKLWSSPQKRPHNPYTPGVVRLVRQGKKCAEIEKIMGLSRRTITQAASEVGGIRAIQRESRARKWREYFASDTAAEPGVMDDLIDDPTE